MSMLLSSRPSRRDALGMAGAFFTWVHAPRFASAAGTRDMRLLTIVLRGALDGLAVVPPLGDPFYLGLREKIALAPDGANAALSLDGFFYLHPAMTELARMYRAGDALICHGIATGYRGRSHFDGQDVLESGATGPATVDDGWLNRFVLQLPRGHLVQADQVAGGRPLLGVGAIPPLVVRGQAPVVGWMSGSFQELPRETADRLLALYRMRDPEFERVFAEGMALDASSKGGDETTEARPKGGKLAERMARVAEGAARIMAGPAGPRIGALAFDGWDTHAAEGGALGRLASRLEGLDQALASIETAMGAEWKNTIVVVVTEFGRTAHVNGTAGTDHGTGTVMFLVGGGVRGGRVVADWPGLKGPDLLDGRDLKPTLDVRAVIKGALSESYGISDAALSETVFPGTRSQKPLQGLLKA